MKKISLILSLLSLVFVLPLFADTGTLGTLHTSVRRSRVD